VTEIDFLKALLSDPEDQMRQVFADWLDDRGDPRALAVRSQPDLFRRLRSLRGRSNGLPADRIWQTAGGSAKRLLLLASFLRGEAAVMFDPSFVEWANSDAFVETLVCAPGWAAVESALRAVAQTGGAERTAREYASRLAAHQPRDVLLRALARHGDDPGLGDLWPCMLQEMVLRGARLAGEQAVESYAAGMRQRGHPLADLPLRLTGVESDLDAALAWEWRPDLPHEQIGTALPDEPEADLPVTWETPDPVACGLMPSAVTAWWGGLGPGRLETRVFEASQPIEESYLSVELVAELGLGSFGGVEERGGFVERVTPAAAFRALFEASAGTAPFTWNATGGAYGRLAAFRSLAGLTGAVGRHAEEIAATAEECLWLRFETATWWKDPWSLDLAILAVRPDRTTVAVLAASDPRD
jgi:uncharacterized protein (TIGR02996 family)